jgi:starch synthase
MLAFADAIITCNAQEARLLQQQYPGKRVTVQAHGVPVKNYRRDCREAARLAFPQICNRTVLLSVGRIDPVKNQQWLVEQAPEVLRHHPSALLVLAGPITDEAYAVKLHQRVKGLGLSKQILFTGGLPQEDPRLLGLLQEARLLLLPSISETFGLVILEAWAAGTAVISTRTSGASGLIRHGSNGWLFDLDTPASFHKAVNEALLNPNIAQQRAEAGREAVLANYDTVNLAKHLKQLYEQLIEEKHALRHPARRRHECPDTARMS